MLIQRLRDRSEGVFSKILIGLIIVVFGLFGFGSITTFLAPVPKVAEVNGEDITQQEMEMSVERNRRLLLAQNVNPLEIDEDSLRSNVLQSLINRKLLSQAAASLDLAFSEEQLDQEIVTTDAFKIDGIFDSQQFQRVIGSAGYSPLSYRREMRQDRLFQQMSQAISGTAFVTSAAIDRAGSLTGQTRDVALLRIDVDSLIDGVGVTDEEQREYYANNQSEFESPETIDIAYLELKRSDFMDDVEVNEADLESFFEERRARYSRAESRRLAHILVETGEDEQASSQEINDIYQKLLNGGDFSELAKEFSDDPGSAANGGDLGFAEPGAYVPEFEDAAFALGMNELSKPVRTEFGYHIIKLLDLTPANEPALEEIRAEVESAYRESLAEELFVSASARLGELAFEAADLIEPAAALGLEVKSTGPVSRNETGGIGASDAVIAAVYSDDLLIDGNNSDVIEITPDEHVVVRVKQYQPSEIRPYEMVASTIAEKLRLQKASDLAEARAREIVDQLESGSLTRYVADQHGLEWQTQEAVTRGSMDLEGGIRSYAFSLPRPDESGKSVGYTTADDGDAVVVTVTNVRNKEPSGSTEADIPGLGRVLAAQEGRTVFSEFQAALADSADIERQLVD
ncbi:MAG: SurA N-terminal domain-containing protein [Proteobacteria bacterium]|jgi:peptidyl-prolyl cis-trans isomerase D|nr:SurA N-terminal domain-containing protein [Pseudomonadota bacterium]